MFVSCVSMLCCPVQVEVSEDGMITRPEESYRVSKYDHAEGKGKPLHLKDPNGYPKCQ
jgi:hypothetical protein